MRIKLVVSTSDVGAQLFKSNVFGRRLNIVPMDKILPKLPDKKCIEAALKMGAGEAFTALSLLRYSNELKGAMEYIFGSTIICRST